LPIDHREERQHLQLRPTLALDESNSCSSAHGERRRQQRTTSPSAAYITFSDTSDMPGAQSNMRHA
jgi:hypothetical protein